ncbi:hypothetical protein FAZ78_06785 [Cereibacter changlensis]|uniref:Uncharacterized protein n=1 Tax=Cereibacter changlensis TaxID=402884 RepID=A0A4U0Z497_9RHOB|nr:hypothetical protein [Cereibacter changlensis]TKA97301.1 hypothetical protein FAZ78_06785 [Cereibacter changlensis]
MGLTRIMAAGGLMLALAQPAAAQGFTPPEGCTGFMTVQSRGCRVSNHYRCEKDAPGDQWRADFDQQGVFFLSRIDSEAQWVESYEMFPTVAQVMDPNPQDPASFTELLGGTDTYAFGLSKDSGERSEVSGFDRLTGRTVVIDGIPLEETAFEFTETSIGGSVLRRARGREYIHRDWRLFFSGPTEWDAGDGSFVPVDGSPMQFIFPGEPGFAATQPIFDCDAILSQSPMDRLLRQVRHDD